MKPAPFEYEAPDSLDAALTLIQEHGYDGKLLAGGQSLLPMMNFRLAQPAMIIDLNNVPGLDGISRDEAGNLLIGAMVRQRTLEQNALVAELAPLVRETIPHIAHPQIRYRGTLGGSLVHADPAAELPAVMVALKAWFELRSAGGRRWVDADDFFLHLFATRCGPEEILTRARVPPLSPGTGYAFEEMARRHGDYALAGVAALITLDEEEICTDARLVYLSAGEVPMIATEAANSFIGVRLSEEIIKEGARLAAEKEIAPVSDIHATSDFKRHLARVLTERALKRAIARARGDSDNGSQKA